MLRASLWRQVLVLWTTAVVLSAALIALDVWRSGPYKFFWLIPYPNLRLIWPMVVNAFRAKPLLVTGGLFVPVLAVLGTLALVSARLAVRVLRISSAG